jgi:hypothetical protein
MRFLSTTSLLNVECRVRVALFELRGPEDIDIYSEDHLADPIVDALLASGTYTAAGGSNTAPTAKPMPTSRSSSPPPTLW